jgi:hypothetical protein
MTDPAVVHEWVRASCASQGVPLRMADLGILADVAGLLGAASRPQAGGRPAPASGASNGDETARVETVETPPPGADDDVINHSRDDRALPGQRKARPAFPQA